jgi:6-phosphogluconolactonase/glucosamine-6-phosphate isomerase/deaminase
VRRPYAEELCARVPIVDGNWPGFDLILVGVGDDGHVLSCFPESPALSSMAWTMGIAAPSHIGPHLPRVTVNPRLLEAAPGPGRDVGRSQGRSPGPRLRRDP